MAVGPDGTWLATAGQDGTVLIRDRATGAVTATFTGHVGSALCIAISQDGTWIVSGGRDGTVRIWDRASAAATVLTAANSVYAVAISPDGTWIASTDGDTVRIWDRATRATTATLTSHPASANALAISPDGAWLATASEDGTAHIWAAHGGQPVTAMRTEGVLSACAWAPSGHVVALAGGFGVYLFELQLGTTSL